MIAHVTNPARVILAILISLTLSLSLVTAYADVVFREGLLEPNSLAAAANRRLEAVGLREEIRLAYREGRFDQCADMLEAVCAANTSLPPASLMLAWMHLEVGRINDAKMVLEQVAGTHPDDPQVALTLGQVALSESRNADAAAHLERTVTLTLPDSWSVAENRDFACRVLDSLAAVYEQQKRWAKAIPALTDLIQLSTQSVGFRIRLARSQYLSGRPLEAKSTLVETASLAKATNDLDEPLLVPLVLGGFSLFDDDTESAATLFHESMAANPDDPRPHNAMARLELSLSRADSALGVIQSSLDTGMASPLLDGVLGDAKLLLGDFDEALRVYQSILDRDPSNMEARRAIVLALLGVKSSESQQEAKDRAQELALQQPYDAMALALLGFVHVQLRQPELARPLLARAVELAPRMSADLAYFLAELAVLEPGGETEAKRLLVAARQGSRGVFLSKFQADLLAAKLGLE